MKRRMFTVKVEITTHHNAAASIIERLGVVSSNNAGMKRGKAAIRNLHLGDWLIEGENSRPGHLQLRNVRDPYKYAAIIVQEVL